MGQYRVECADKHEERNPVSDSASLIQIRSDHISTSGRLKVQIPEASQIPAPST